MPNSIEELEEELDKAYQEMKAAFAVIRRSASRFGIGGTGVALSAVSPAPAPAPTSTAAGRPSIADQVRAAIMQQGDTFKLAQLTALCPDLKPQQISNALTMLKEAQQIHVVTAGRGNNPAVYGKGAAPAL